MKKIMILGATVAVLAACNTNKNNTQEAATVVEPQTEPEAVVQKNIYDFTVEDIDGNPYALADLKGKKVMIVNTASECGFTPQYKDLEELYNKYKDSGFTIIGFPANNFKGQEPGTNEEIKKFCTENFNVTFPMMSKISVEGADQHPLYQYLTQKAQNGKMDSEVKWNFQKYLIDENGNLVEVYYSKTKPNDPAIIAWIES